MDSGSTEKTPSKRSRQLPNIDAVRHMLKARRKLGVCEFTGLECENGALEWNTGVEY